MSEQDPIAALAVGLNEDAKAARKPGKKATAAAAQAKAEASDAGSPPADAEALGTAVGDAVAQATGEPVPPAPGEDRESVFDRRLNRLDALVEQADFETGSAFGDLRDTMLDLYKHRPNVWTAMSKDEQQSCVRAIEAAARRIVHKLVIVIAQEDSEAIEATLLPGFNVKADAVEAKIKIDNVDGDLLLDTFKLAGHRVMVISADDKRFMSARREAEVQEDQLAIKFADGAVATPAKVDSPAGPAGDADLADGDDSPSAVDVAKGEAGGVFGVFDSGGEEWLESLNTDGDKDIWTGNSADALRMTEAEAIKLADEYGGGAFVARAIVEEPAGGAPDNEAQAED